MHAYAGQVGSHSLIFPTQKLLGYAIDEGRYWKGRCGLDNPRTHLLAREIQKYPNNNYEDLAMAVINQVFNTTSYVDMGTLSIHRPSPRSPWFVGPISSPRETGQDTTGEKEFYQPLESPRDIRVLGLKHGSADELLRCTLETVSLDNAPQYEALSYVWGDELNRRSIMCNRAETTVTANLELALTQLRYPEKDRWLWVDALCINQQDNFEKSQQVGMMADIYRGAHLVLIWLGMADEETGQAWEMFRAIDRWHPKGEDSEHIEQENHDRSTCMLVDGILPPMGLPGWKALRNLLSRPHFSRSWTWQEVILARKGSVICGEFSIDADDFFRYIRYLDHLPDDLISALGYGWLSVFATSNYRATHQHTMEVLKTRRLCEHELYFSQLSLILQTTRERNAKDARDKVFSVFGSLMRQFHPPLRPDYSMEIRDVFITAAALCIIADADLTIFSSVELRVNTSELPSWVPDWRSSNHLFPLGNCRSNGAGAFSACGKTRLATGYDPQIRQVVMVRGAFVAIVQQTKQVNIILGDPLHTVEFAWPSDWPPEQVATMRSNLHTTLAADLLPTGGRLTTREEATLFPAHFKWKKKGAQLPCPPEVEEEAKKHRISVCTNRSIFIGFQYIGLGPRTMKEGDIICVLKGGRVPFVLRSRRGPVLTGFNINDGFTLVGECYVHNIMDGQIMDQAKEDSFINFVIW